MHQINKGIKNKKETGWRYPFLKRSLWRRKYL